MESIKSISYRDGKDSKIVKRITANPTDVSIIGYKMDGAFYISGKLYLFLHSNQHKITVMDVMRTRQENKIIV